MMRTPEKVIKKISSKNILKNRFYGTYLVMKQTMVDWYINKDE